LTRGESVGSSFTFYRNAIGETAEYVRHLGRINTSLRDQSNLMTRVQNVGVRSWRGLGAAAAIAGGGFKGVYNALAMPFHLLGKFNAAMLRLVERQCDLCQCKIMVRARVLRNNDKLGRKWGRFCRRCSNIVRVMGKKNPNFKRGHRSYHSVRVKSDRRAAIRRRDGYRCVQCGTYSRELDPTARVLDVHHVIPVADPGSDDTDDNLVSLCRRCHNNVEHGRAQLVWWPRSGRANPWLTSATS
jgi:5-methylcytosine-specific restriction endonuclease McrA